ncbi:MAG TPA: S8 family serine peptidase [Armatimonadota bacterium]|nr:S8 family serine peptidase [Armatimonadota bacterium]
MRFLNRPGMPLLVGVLIPLLALGSLSAAAAPASLRFVVPHPPTAAEAPSPAPASGRARGLMIAFQPSASLTARQEVLRRYGLTPTATNSAFMARVQAPLAAQEDTPARAALVRALHSEPAVRVAEPDYLLHAAAVPNDPRFASLWGMRNTGQTGGVSGADIDAVHAWDVTTGSGQVIVGIIDTGVDYNHPDLAANILRDGSGHVVGYDYANNDSDPMDDNEHGTHVAGTIGAVGNNGIGVIGVCPNVKLMPLKFLDASGSGATSDAIKCIDYAIAHGAKILNNSWGGGGESQLLKEAINRARAAGILFVAAAGNESSNNDLTPSYPAAYTSQLDNILTVAATDDRDQVASFSNYGAATVDLAAPGVSILSTTPNNTYSTFSGTSMATPMVSGAAALLLSRYPDLTLAQLKTRLLANTDQPAGVVGKVRTGRLDLYRALVQDSAPPGVPAAFTATHRGSSALLLTWTASGDDGAAGTAAAYDLRYSTQPITEANFPSAAAASGLPAPAASGAAQRFLLSGLRAGASYYVALRATDRVGNTSPLATLGPLATLAGSSPIVPLSDSVEGTRLFSGTATWAATTETSSSPSHSYTDSPGAQYRNNTDSSLTQNAGVALTGFAPSLTFHARTDLENGFDYLYVEASTDDGATWARLPFGLTGATGWTLYRISLAPLYGSSLRVRFRMVADSRVAAGGVWIDDIEIGGDTLQPFGGSVPAAPSNLVASALSQTEAGLTWSDNSPDETAFKIERRAGAEAYSQVAALPAGTTSYRDSGLTAGAAYTYRVRAVNDSGDSPYSNEAAVTLPLDAPSAPTGLTARASDGRVTLSWTASAGAATYRVKRASASAGPYALIASGVTGTTYTDVTVQNGTTYYYRVSAVGPGGESLDTTVVSATPRLEPAQSRPAAPTNARASIGRRQVSLRWTQSTSPGIVRNRVYRSKTPGGQYTLLASVTARTRFTDRNVSRSTSYYYVITAVDRNGQESFASNEAAASIGARWRSGGKGK